jgi:hypothetical protein
LIQDHVDESRKAIGDETTERALAEGRAMPRAEAVAYARKSSTNRRD